MSEISSENQDTSSFKPYLDAVVNSGERTRRTSYTILFIIFFLVFAIRNTQYPAWYDTLLSTMERYYTCHTSPQIIAADCQRLNNEYSNDMPLPSAIPADLNKSNLSSGEIEQIRRFHKRLDALIQANVSSFTASIPLIGITINSNDLWILSGPGLGILLLLLHINLQSDLANINIAIDNANTVEARHLLIMSQVINKKGSSQLEITRIAQIIYIFLLLAMLTLLNLVILSQFPFTIDTQLDIEVLSS